MGLLLDAVKNAAGVEPLARSHGRLTSPAALFLQERAAPEKITEK